MWPHNALQSTQRPQHKPRVDNRVPDGHSPSSGSHGKSPLKLKAFWVLNVNKGTKFDILSVFCNLHKLICSLVHGYIEYFHKSELVHKKWGWSITAIKWGICWSLALICSVWWIRSMEASVLQAHWTHSMRHLITNIMQHSPHNHSFQYPCSRNHMVLGFKYKNLIWFSVNNTKELDLYDINQYSMYIRLHCPQV